MKQNVAFCRSLPSPTELQHIVFDVSSPELWESTARALGSIYRLAAGAWSPNTQRSGGYGYHRAEADIRTSLWYPPPPLHPTAIPTGLIEFRRRTTPSYLAGRSRINITNLFTSLPRAEFYIMCFIVYGTGYSHKARIAFRNTSVVFIEETIRPVCANLFFTAWL